MCALQVNTRYPSPSSSTFGSQQYRHPHAFPAPSCVTPAADYCPPCSPPSKGPETSLAGSKRTKKSCSLPLPLLGTARVLWSRTGSDRSPLTSWLNPVLMAFELGDVGHWEAAFAHLPSYTWTRGQRRSLCKRQGARGRNVSHPHLPLRGHRAQTTGRRIAP